MEPVYDSFKYLNIYEKNQSVNSKEQAAFALKLLYSYQDIIGKQIEDFSATDFVLFKDFLRGNTYIGQIINLKNLTTRSTATINGYLSIYRSYLIMLGKKNDILSNTFTFINKDKKQQSKKFRINEKTKEQEFVDYISVEDYKTIIKLIREKFTLRDEIICRLMFEAGLRIGEVLGLTNEDVTLEYDDSGNVTPIIYIRNRLNDKYFQKAKTCCEVKSKNDYKSEVYNTPMAGYQTTYISKDLYELIGDYVNDVHDKQRKKHKERYFKGVIADTVDGDEENFYIFLNNCGSVLSQKVWNEYLRKIFKEANIPVDKNVRKHNLSHRFRHGFAMFQIQNNHIGQSELMILMRHKNINSIRHYFKPSTSDKINLKKQFTTELTRLIPELERDNAEKEK